MNLLFGKARSLMSFKNKDGTAMVEVPGKAVKQFHKLLEIEVSNRVNIQKHSDKLQTFKYGALNVLLLFLLFKVKRKKPRFNRKKTIFEKMQMILNRILKGEISVIVFFPIMKISPLLQKSFSNTSQYSQIISNQIDRTDRPYLTKTICPHYRSVLSLNPQ